MKRPLTPEESLVQWRCCPSMEEHLEHLAHLKRVYERAAVAKAKNEAALRDLIEKLEASVKADASKG